MGAPAAIKNELERDKRDIADLWKEALNSYKGIVGFDLTRKFDNVDAMVAFGTKEMNNFHKFRHNDKKVDKLRGLFKANLEAECLPSRSSDKCERLLDNEQLLIAGSILESGAQQLIAAATPAFPPAAAIGTAITFLLTACRQVSADYDVVIVFFDDMNSFLQRIKILESRLPQQRAYQNCLMDVFTSFLKLCGFAHKYIELGRFKKWISNLLQGEDTDLGGARKTMDEKLDHLRQATEFAILGNTEETKQMSIELNENQEQHTKMLQEQRLVMDSIDDRTKSIQDDMAKLLKMIGTQTRSNAEGSKDKTKASSGQKKPPSANQIRNLLPTVKGETYEYHILKETLVPGTCSWVFSDPAWSTWLDQKQDLPILAITGQPGVGKSHLAASVFDKLASIAREDTSNHTCAAHFYFRQQQADLTTFNNALVTALNQIAEQSANLCEKINAELTRDDNESDFCSWKDLTTNVLAPVIGEKFQGRVYLVLDGVDELPDNEVKSLMSFIELARKKKLPISLVLTARPEILSRIPNAASTTEVEANKDKQMADMKALVWHRLNNNATLKGFSRYVKQRIADKVEEVAPNMLYAERVVMRLEKLGREGAVLHELGQPMPKDLNGMYDIMLTECQRRTPENLQHVLETLFCWVSYSFRTLYLDEVTSLLKVESGRESFDLEEIPQPFASFLRVGDPGTDVEAHERLQAEGANAAVKDLEQIQDANNLDRFYNDGVLPVKFVERSMRSFFQPEPSNATSLRLRPSEGHRRMFLVCSQIIKLSPPAQPSPFHVSLRAYATYYWVDHWLQIDHTDHSQSELSEVFEQFGLLMSGRSHFTSMIEWRQAEINYKKKFTQPVRDRISLWAQLWQDSFKSIHPSLSEGLTEWWDEVSGDTGKAFVELAKGHIRRFNTAKTIPQIFTRYEFACQAIELSGLDNEVLAQASKNFPNTSLPETPQEAIKPKTAIIGIPGLFKDVELGIAGQYATAEILLKHKFDDEAAETCRQILASCDQNFDKFRVSHLLARIQWDEDQNEDAHQSITACLDLFHDDAISAETKREAMVTKARIEKDLGRDEAAVHSYQRARSLDPGNPVKGDILDEELQVYVDKGDKKAIIETIRGWTPLERLTWMASDTDHIVFREAAAEAGEKEFMVEAYEGVIRLLDNVGAGAPMRCELALGYKEVCRDFEAVKRILLEVLDSHSNGSDYAITGESPDYTLMRAIIQASDGIYEMFNASRDPKVKQELLTTVQGLMQRQLALDVPPQSESYILQHRIILARMFLKMGPAAEFQRILQSVMDSCFHGLADKVGWNDETNLAVLAVALMHLSEVVTDGNELRKTAQVIYSARFSVLNPEDDSTDGNNSDNEGENNEDQGTEENGGPDDAGSDSEESEEEDESDSESESDDDEEDSIPTDEGDIDKDCLWWCDGSCYPSTKYLGWKGRKAYQCLICADGFFCEPCYEKRQAANRGEPAMKGRTFCSESHTHFQVPAENWQGIKDGKVTLPNGEIVLFNDFLKDVRERICPKAWEDFWKGG